MSMKRLLLLADVVDPDAVEAELDELGEPVADARPGRPRRAPARARPRGARKRAASSKCSGSSRSQHTGGCEHVGPPLVVGDGQRLVVGRRPRHVHLQVAPACRRHRRRRNASSTPRSTSASWLTVISPSAQPPTQRGRLPATRRRRSAAAACGGSVHRRARSTRDQPVVGDLLAGEQRPHHLDALGQAAVAHRPCPASGRR